MKKSASSRKEQRALTLLFSGLVFATLLVVVLISGAVLLLLVHTGVLSSQDYDPRSGYLLVGLMVLFSTVMGAVLTVFVSYLISSPVNTIISGMNRLAAGDYQVRIRFPALLARQPVLAELTDSFNTMAAELEGTELLRSDFINNFSHEFKTPIVSIAGFAKLLRYGCPSAQERDEYLAIIEDESMRLSDMATNVLNMTKIENQTILTGVTRFNLSEQLRNCVLLLERRWTEKALELDLELDEFMIEGNEDLLRQVWMNLLGNAVKFTPQGGTVRVAVQQDGDMLAVSVSNTGSSIPPDKLETIFRKFYQADESHAAEGNGLGLAIVRSVVRLHGGSVRAESQGDYTTFTVRLPQRPAASSVS